MWKVAVSMRLATIQSTVSSNTSGVSWSMPKMKLPLTMMPASWMASTAAS